MSVFQHAPQSGAADAQALGRAGLVIAVLFQNDLYDLPVDLAQWPREVQRGRTGAGGARLCERQLLLQRLAHVFRADLRALCLGRQAAHDAPELQIILRPGILVQQLQRSAVDARKLCPGADRMMVQEQVERHVKLRGLGAQGRQKQRETGKPVDKFLRHLLDMGQVRRLGAGKDEAVVFVHPPFQQKSQQLTPLRLVQGLQILKKQGVVRVAQRRIVMAQQIGPGFPALQAAVDLYKRLAAHGAAQVQDPRCV